MPTYMKHFRAYYAYKQAIEVSWLTSYTSCSPSYYGCFW